MDQFSLRIKDINNELISLIPLQQSLLTRMELDVMFIIDCTGSMSSWIDAAKNEIKSIIEYITAENESIDVRMSFIGYRDHCDAKDQFAVMDFTKNIDQIVKFVSTQGAQGGGDGPEDVAGGLSLALSQSWKASTKYAIFIADAPGHGDTYHAPGGDDYPKGDPKGRKLEDLIKQFAKKDINLYAIKINSYTDIMYKIFEDCYHKECGKKLVIGDLGNSTKSFGFFISTSLRDTVSKTTLKNDKKQVEEILKNLKHEENFSIIEKEVEEEKSEISKEEDRKILEFTFEKQIPSFNEKSFLSYEAICHTYFIVKDKDVEINWSKPLIQKSQITTMIKINQKPFAAGAMRYAFYMKDVGLNENLVGKLPKVLDKSYNPTDMKKELETVFISSHIVNEFNDRIVSLLPNPNMLMSFVHCYIYEILSDNYPYKYLWVENLIKGEYEKFNNNAGWVVTDLKQTSLVAQALSHFSWQLTKGYLMIVDIQGGTGVLTDPQIHCLDKKRFGSGNMGYPGIVKFFLSHKCNYYCKELGLISPKENCKIPMNCNFFTLEIKEPKKNEIINKICDLCQKTYKISSFTYFENRKKFPECYCDHCQKEKNATMSKGRCIDCKQDFRSSEYWFIMKRTDFPIRCPNCRRANRDKMRSELEQDKEINESRLNQKNQVQSSAMNYHSKKNNDKIERKENNSNAENMDCTVKTSTPKIREKPVYVEKPSSKEIKSTDDYVKITTPKYKEKPISLEKKDNIKSSSSSKFSEKPIAREKPADFKYNEKPKSSMPYNKGLTSNNKNTYSSLSEKLKEEHSKKEIGSSYLGFFFNSENKDKEVTVKKIAINGIAHQKGIEVGDIIINVQGENIDNLEELIKIFEFPSMSTMNVQVKRGEKILDFQF